MPDAISLLINLVLMTLNNETREEHPEFLFFSKIAWAGVITEATFMSKVNSK